MDFVLEKVKIALRIRTANLDDEILDLVQECLNDLRIAGVTNLDPLDSLILRAIKVYCKSQIGIDNKDSEKYYESYVMLKQHLCLCSDYEI